MPKPYSPDLRERVIDAVKKGEMRRRAAARRYEISESVAIKWLERVERDGSREPVGRGGHRASKLAPHRVGARLVFLPKYSPDLNPIEQVFAKFKTLLRKAAARSYDAVSQACAHILAQYPPEECAAYIRNAGYA